MATGLDGEVAMNEYQSSADQREARKLDVPSSSANNSSSRAELVTEIHGDNNVTVIEANQGPSTRYCCCCRRPGCMQCFASIKWFVVFVCLLVTSTALMIGIFQGSLTTTETRYQLSASQLGLASAMFTVGSVISTIIVSHFGGRPGSHRPCWIGIGAVTMATGCFIICLPQFVFGPYEYSSLVDNATSSADGTCEPGYIATSTPLNCDTEKTQMVHESYVAYALIITGQIVIGLGYGPLMPLALAFIDDNTDVSTTGLYSGIIESMWGVGAIIGFQISATTVSLWVDFYRVDMETIDITPRDPRYVGAWWLGLLIASSLFLFFAVPFWGFPRRLAHKACPQRHNGNMGKTEKRSTVALAGGDLSFKELLLSLWRLCSNKVYASLCVTMIMHGAIIYSFSAFLPKYLENEFGLPTEKANITVGFVLVPAYGFGAIFGGILVKRLNLKAQGSAMLSMILILIGCILSVSFIFLGCPNQPVAGINTGYQNRSLRRNTSLPPYVSPCNANCGCSPFAEYSPVCGSDGVTYFSSCFAGCLDANENKTYSDCACVQTDEEPAQATTGPCVYKGCSSLVAFLILMFFGNFMLAAIVPSRIVIIVSSVTETDKSLAIGVSRVIMLLLGSIPGPIIYGALIDTACILWQYTCDKRGACWVYDIEHFRHVFGITTSLIIALEFVFFTFTWLFVKLEGNKDARRDVSTHKTMMSTGSDSEGKPMPE